MALEMVECQVFCCDAIEQMSTGQAKQGKNKQRRDIDKRPHKTPHDISYQKVGPGTRHLFGGGHRFWRSQLHGGVCGEVIGLLLAEGGGGMEGSGMPRQSTGEGYCLTILERTIALYSIQSATTLSCSP